MATVVALHGFEHDGRRRRGDKFDVSEGHARAMVEQDLVRIVGESKDPGKAAGEKSSASPAAPASPKTTAKKSKRGAKEGSDETGETDQTKEPSSSPTPPSE